ncbi:ROK family transcriptional regulator [Brooklawnia cerclae]|uniref:NBD/HSP70 family sugar kinase n=1 Tax=Brooklawnia cerclae TaxID=349934 RepID=A0ABX0SCT0_9ACTN|nr:ROK family transcriptional regulator [Brooklawnia cerclae]NIH56203.1 putative NBD/HSP70 family sugar kinase [Brooklawnia cerclae]
MKTSGIRKRTRRAIYDFIRERGMATKNDIAGALGISLPTVSKYLTHFMEAGLLEQGAKLSSGSNGGRSPIAYACVADGRLAVGVDVTQDRVTCLVVNLERQVLCQRQAHRDFARSDDYFAFVGAEVETLLADAGVDRDRILGVGVAVPGLISETTGQVTYGRVIDNYGITAADFGRHLRFRTRLLHDSDAAGLAEFWPDHGVDNAFYISLSKSIGGSVLINGEIYRGDGEFAGEIGHLRIHQGGRRCYCGQNGCMDAYCNASVLARHADGSLEGFFSRLGDGDDTLSDVWDRYTSDLAQAIHNIRVLFGCTIILGGDVGAHIRDHMTPLRSKVDRLSFLASHSETFLVPCSYTTQPVATGAALYLVDEFRQDLGPGQPRAGGTSGRALRKAVPLASY